MNWKWNKPAESGLSRRDVAAIISMLNERFPEAGGVDDDVIEFLQIACQQKWITCREPE